MLNASAHEFGWKTVLMALATRNRDLRLVAGETLEDEQVDAAVACEPAVDDDDAFHLDDTEMADRLSPSRSQPTHATTPPHAHLMFPMLGRLVR